MKEQLKAILQKGGEVYFSTLAQKGLPSNGLLHIKATHLFNEIITAKVDNLNNKEVATYIDIFNKLSLQKSQQITNEMIGSFLGLDTPNGKFVEQWKALVAKCEFLENSTSIAHDQQTTDLTGNTEITSEEYA